jgi:hypothetical protein
VRIDMLDYLHKLVERIAVTSERSQGWPPWKKHLLK